MIKKTCPACGGNSYSAYNDPDWKCPYCGENLGDKTWTNKCSLAPDKKERHLYLVEDFDSDQASLV